MSFTSAVPAPVPSLFHSSFPCAPSSATKNSSLPTTMSSCGTVKLYAAPFGNARTSFVPLAVPSLVQRPCNFPLLSEQNSRESIRVSSCSSGVTLQSQPGRGVAISDSAVSESAVVAKAMWRLIPLAILLYILNYLDCVNVSFAKLEMNRELGFSERVYGFGAGIFFVGYFLFEVPSNLIMQRVGARVWIARIMITWGAISAAMMFVQGVKSFYTLRLLLGLAAAGFFRAIILY